MQADKDLQIIESAQKRSRLIKLTVSALLFAASILLINYSDILFFNFVGAGLVLVATYFTMEALQILSFGENDPGKLILKKPEKIVWVYPYVVQNMPYGIEVFRSATIFFKLTDGSHITLDIPRKQQEPLMDALRRRLPHTTFGYSEEKAFLFHAEPRLLIRTTRKSKKKRE